MHTLTFYIVTIWLALLFVAVALRTVLTRKRMDRILAINTLTLPLIALLSLFALFDGRAFPLDAALILALLSFIGTIAAVVYQGKWRFF